MSINAFNCKFQSNRQLRLEIESRIDELAEIETKICERLMKNPDCVQEALQPFIDTNPDYVNPLKLKDNSSRLRVLEHIEKAELLAENGSNYAMQPFPLYNSISWTLESQIPIKNYEFPQGVKPIKSNGSTFLSSLLPIVTSTEEGWLDLVSPAQEDINKELTTFKDLSSFANMVSCSSANSNIGAGIRNTQLQSIAEESVDVSPVFGTENPEVEKELDFGVVNGEENEILESIPENKSKNHCIMDVFSRNYASQGENNGFYWPLQVTTENYDVGNAVDKKTNLKFQYAALIGDNLEREIPNSENCIILVCKECGFHEYI